MIEVVSESESDMAKRKVQQFYACEDDFYELGGTQTLDLTGEELTVLMEASGEPVLLEGRNGFFALVDND